MKEAHFGCEASVTSKISNLGDGEATEKTIIDVSIKCEGCRVNDSFRLSGVGALRDVKEQIGLAIKWGCVKLSTQYPSGEMPEGWIKQES